MRLLDELAEGKRKFGAAAAPHVRRLLKALRSETFREPAELLALHETALFFRAYPPDAETAEAAEAILRGFAHRLEGIDVSILEAPDVSGAAGTSVSTNYSFEFAASLLARHADAIEIDWENYQRPDRLGPVLARVLPSAMEDWAVEPHVDWRSWWEASKASVPWLMRKIDPLAYDQLEIPLRWDLNDSEASRTRLRMPHPTLFFHHEPLLRRADVSLEAEFAAPPIPVRALAPSKAQRVMNVIVDASAVRYRELWGFQHPDLEHFYRADFGRGLHFYYCGVPRQWRLPLRAYHGGMYFKNGVPIGYFEGLSLFERMEAGFNLYPTFREGETAWLYARTLKLFREQLGVRVFSIDPYQLGEENEEAIESGAFWFYRKLGFRPLDSEVARLLAREEEKLRANPRYRTPPGMLRKLARAPLFYGPAEDWAGFSVHAVAKRGIGPLLPKAKRGPEESDYLRQLQARPDLRRAVIAEGKREYNGLESPNPASYPDR
jgi:hypothetical protein